MSYVSHDTLPETWLSTSPDSPYYLPYVSNVTLRAICARHLRNPEAAEVFKQSPKQQLHLVDDLVTETRLAIEATDFLKAADWETGSKERVNNTNPNPTTDTFTVATDDVSTFFGHVNVLGGPPIGLGFSRFPNPSQFAPDIVRIDLARNVVVTKDGHIERRQLNENLSWIEGGHIGTITEINKAQETVTYIDPNRPDLEIVVPFEMLKDQFEDLTLDVLDRQTRDYFKPPNTSHRSEV